MPSARLASNAAVAETTRFSGYSSLCMMVTRKNNHVVDDFPMQVNPGFVDLVGFGINLASIGSIVSRIAFRCAALLDRLACVSTAMSLPPLSGRARLEASE